MALLRNTSIGPPIILLAFIVLSVVPVASFTMLTVVAGFMYGFHRGVILAILGSFLGSIFCFCLIHKVNLEDHLKLSKNNQDRHNILLDIINKSGLLMAVLIRWSFLPCSVSNIMLSKASNSRFGHYSLAAAIGSVKVLPKVWLGSQMTTFVNPLAPVHSNHVTQYAMGSSTIISILVGLWVLQKARTSSAL
ncbi:hypothetical protein CLU79DRAFT_840940 [Phycomyces nitens]|nr:hypothetical protein CLU79DRAFT_840940 [Phycomyces nitens]